MSAVLNWSYLFDFEEITQREWIKREGGRKKILNHLNFPIKFTLQYC